MKLQKNIWAVAAAAGLLMVGAAHARSTADNLVWPDVDNSYQSEGDFIAPQSVLRVKAGVSTKDEVRLLLNNPQFSEGYFGEREWDYIFNFYTGNGTEYVTCQYKVLFDDKYVASSTHWKNSACESALQDRKPVAAPVKHAMILDADGLFAFGKSGLYDLQPTGRDRLTNFALQVNSAYSVVRSVVVTGHTDRIGSAAANQVLSEERANTVKAFLMSKGVPANVIRTQGFGASQPVVTCSGARSPAVIACLMPNRRVELAVDGDAK